MLSQYKDRFQGISDPVARALWRARLRPNQLTVLGLGVSALAAWAFAEGQLRLGAVLLAVAGLFDFFDGALARRARQETSFGAFLDSVVDRYSDLVVLLGVLVLYERTADPIGRALAMATLVGTVMVSYTKARAQSIGVACEIGLMERPERLIGLIVGAAFNALTPMMVVLAVLTNVTALQRIFHTRRAARALAAGALSAGARRLEPRDLARPETARPDGAPSPSPRPATPLGRTPL
jgi:CDP-diacylglycerol--glycerol-3-phosphate 3-phosphatidyltransferase